VVRNVLFFALCALVVVPLSLNIGRGSAQRALDIARGRINLALMTAALAALSIAVIATLVRPATQFEYSHQRAGVLTAVRSATGADPRLKVYADVRFADWLLWRDPALASRIANDARFELLTPAQTSRLLALNDAIGTNFKQAANGYRLIVLDRRYAPDTVSAFVHEPGARVLYDDGERIVLLRSASQAQ
jgi:hypothetical protein